MQILFFLLNIILISNLIILTKEEDECSYDDCFNCVACGNKEVNYCECYWKNNLCKSGKKRSITYTTLSSSCTDESSIELINKFCGQTTLKLNDDNVANVNIPSVNWKYGMTNLFCSYIYSPSEPEEKYYIINYEVPSNNLDNIQIYLSILQNDDNTILGSLSKYSFSRSLDDIKEIKLMVYFEKSLNNIPFTFSIEEKKYKSKILTIIAIALVIVFIITCTIFIISLSKKARERRTSIHFGERRIIVLNDNDNGKNEEENKKKVENLIKSSLTSQIYNENNGIKNKCSICLEDLKVGIDKVSITPCKHIFHYDCLRKWLLENYQLPKCPNCNYNIVEYFESLQSHTKLALNQNTNVNNQPFNGAVTSNENFNIDTNHNSDNNRNSARNGLSNNINQENY